MVWLMTVNLRSNLCSHFLFVCTPMSEICINQKLHLPAMSLFFRRSMLSLRCLLSSSSLSSLIKLCTNTMFITTSTTCLVSKNQHYYIPSFTTLVYSENDHTSMEHLNDLHEEVSQVSFSPYPPVYLSHPSGDPSTHLPLPRHFLFDPTQAQVSKFRL
jgi:hypothetical protein